MIAPQPPGKAQANRGSTRRFPTDRGFASACGHRLSRFDANNNR
jgi:hypothetical protein